ncbi:NAD(+) synthase [Slackia heliotrinireducens]|uniref:NAD(+) synthase n=1 Tax=Slackia heliotrinireducens TaxID=84110 RepID=UPI003315F96D
MDIAEKYQVCINGLTQFLHSTRTTDVVLGLSGGIDSSLVACMCVEVLGPEHVHGYMLPGPYSTDHSLIDAQLLANNLGLNTEIISIVGAYDAFAAELAVHCNGFGGLAAENTQARCRMVMLMALSNAHGWMLINTGNKSEACMGYSTLYGDTAGAYAPIGGLYKTDVFAASRYVNARAEQAGLTPPIPEHVLVKPPSAELAPGQVDEATLGSYAELDRLLIDHVEHGMGIPELVMAGYDADEVQRVVKRVASYEFKRNLEPPFPKVVY